MEVGQYYITTLTTAFKNIAPYVVFFLGGYFVFIKMPFLFLKKSLDDQKKKIDQGESKITIKSEPIERLKLASNQKSEQKQKTEKKEQTKQTKQERPSRGLSPEEVLGFKSHEVISKDQLKKRYFELLKMNHPDRVASMGDEFKKLADKNTKEINEAYEKLKKKAA